MDVTEGGGVCVGISNFWEKLENSILNQKSQELPSVCLHFQTFVLVSKFTFKAVTTG